MYYNIFYDKNQVNTTNIVEGNKNYAPPRGQNLVRGHTKKTNNIGEKK